MITENKAIPLTSVSTPEKPAVKLSMSDQEKLKKWQKELR